MKLKLRIRSFRGVFHWLAEDRGGVYWIGPVADFSLHEICLAAETGRLA